MAKTSLHASHMSPTCSKLGANRDQQGQCTAVCVHNPVDHCASTGLWLGHNVCYCAVQLLAFGHH